MTEASQSLTPDTQLFRDLFSASPIGITVEDLEGQPLFANPAFCRFLGFTEEELRSKHCVDFSPEEDAAKDWALFQQLRAGSIDHYQLDKRYFRRDGSLVWGRLIVSLLRSRPSPLVLAMVEDITEKKKAEEELANADERLHLAIESGSVGGWDYDLKTGKNVWFGKAHAQFGMVPNETEGSIQEFWTYVHEEDREHFAATIRVAKEKHEDFTKDFRVVWRDGTTHWLRSRGRYHYAENGEPVRSLGISIDITESKEAERALRDSEQRFRLAAQAGKVYAYEYDVVKDRVIRSPEYAAILGLRESEHFTYQQFLNSIHPDDRSIFLGSIAALTPNNPTSEVMYRFRRRTGEVIWLKSSGRGFFDGEGKLLRVIGMVADNTDQKRAEVALRTSEERLRLAQQAARLGTFERDVRTGGITWAEGLESLYGLPLGSVHGQTPAFFNDLIHPADRETVAHLIQEALKTGQPTEGEWRAMWPDGSVHWIAGRWQVLMDVSGEPSKVVGVNMDVTARKLAEQALRAHQELLKIFVKNVPAAVAMLDRDMRYLQVSDRWCSDFSLDGSEMLGRSHYEIFPDIPERWKQIHRRALAGETVRAEEDPWDREGGTTWLRWEIRPWHNQDGVQGGILIFSEDITDRKQMEETLSDMSRKLTESQEQERARIARELHDDINQRLAILAIEIAQLQGKPSEIKNRMKELQNQIGEISHDVEGLAHDLHSSKLEHLGVIAGMKGWCREFAERQRMEIDFRSEATSALPLELGLSLFRVLQEALHNAAKHSGVKRVAVQLQEESGEVHLVIKDLGKGFDIEAARQGRGLGLTSMKERLKLLKGTLSIESQSERGTTVHARVPLSSGSNSMRAAG